MKNLFPLFFIAIAMVLPNSVPAADEVTAKSSTKFPATVPKEVKILGQPYELHWSDGREATLFRGKVVPYVGTNHIIMYENECSRTVKAVRCSYAAQNVMTLFELRWSKHPDASKIGKVVKMVTPDNTFPLDSGYVFVGLAHKVNGHPWSSLMGPEVLTCQHWNWIDQWQGKTPEHLKFHKVSSEFMSVNGETGQNENQTINVVYNLKFDRQTDGSYNFKEYSDYLSHPSFVGGAFVAGDIFRTDVDLGDKQSCMSAFKVDFSDNASAAAEAEVRSEYKPYLYEKDELYRQSFLLLDFNVNGEVYGAE